jgi:hypothetical protein
MLTPILHNKSSFECFFFHQVPNYTFLCTFMCLCFPFLHPYNAHKLDYRSTRCVFLSSSSYHLGYCCLDLSSNHIYISLHLCFRKQYFLFLESDQVSISAHFVSIPALISQTHGLSLPSFRFPYHYLHLCLLIILQVQV